MGWGLREIADLVLLDGYPLADIRNVRRVFAVLRDGRLVGEKSR